MHNLGEKYHFLFIFVFTSIFAISIFSFIIQVINFSMSLRLKELEEKAPDVEILAMEDFIFIENYESKEYYNPSISKLGITGSIIYDCVVGLCEREGKGTCTYEVCPTDDEDNNSVGYYLPLNITKNINGKTIVEKTTKTSNKKTRKLNSCHQVEYECIKFENISNYDCSKYCKEEKSKYCFNVCPTSYGNYFDDGFCKSEIYHNYDDSYICEAKNIIYYWKNLYFQNYVKKYSYLENAVKYEEECPEGKKFCGILDKNNNKLCVDNDEECPVNFMEILDSPPEGNYNFKNETLKDKYIYYSNEFNKTGRIIEGLFVDSDLEINYDEKSCEILDNYTISGLIQDNKDIYRDLTNDPYNEDSESLDKKGKSYLKKCSPGWNHSADLDEIRKNKDIYLYNIKMNEEEVIPKSKKYLLNQFLFFLFGLFYFLIFFIAFMWGIYYGIEKKRSDFCRDNCDSENEIIYVTKIILTFIPFIALSILSIGWHSKLINNLDKANKYYDGNKIKAMIVLSYIFFYGNILIYACFFILYVLAIKSYIDEKSLSSKDVNYSSEKQYLL